MAIRFYDSAVTEKIKKWILDPNLRLLKPDETSRLFEMTFDQNNDSPLSLPLIAISRDKTVEILETQKQPKTFKGILLTPGSSHFNPGDTLPTTSIPLNVIPIKISYQIDIYTRYMDECDEYVRNFVFNIINYPKVLITIPYNSVNFTHESTIHLDSSINDNSDIKEHLFPDQFTRFTLKFYVDDAYLFSAPVVTNSTLELGELNIEDRITSQITEESLG